MSEEGKVLLVAMVMAFSFFMTMLYGAINTDNQKHIENLAKIKAQTQCYKQTIESNTSILHRIKCPMGEVK